MQVGGDDLLHPARTDRFRPSEDWWVAAGAIYHQHGYFDSYDWRDLVTVSGLCDVRNGGVGKGLSHPKVYMGFLSHSAYWQKSDMGCGGLTNQPPWLWNEYRSDLTLYRALPEHWCNDARVGWKGKNNH
jgi:hypothetical protein